MQQIAIYGKGGIGKSTTAANLSAALSINGLSVLQVGCDPKRDSTRMLMGGKLIPTVMDLLKIKGERGIDKDEIIFSGFNGIKCVEAGGPDPGIGCAGRGIIATFQILAKLGAMDADIVIYDVLGDVVCGGFAMPMRESFAEEVYLVTSGELMSLYAANNICKAIERISKRPKNRCRLAGVICNAKNLYLEEDLVREFSDMIGSKLIHFIPRDPAVQVAELNRMTVIEDSPDSEMAYCYSDLAKKVLNNNSFVIPKPLELDALEELAQKYRPL